jgi:23S rRNA (uracil1939-C5)-methyltransferase
MKLKLEKPVYGGDCLAHLPGDGGRPGKAVFVPLTLPGERVKAHVTEDKRNFVKAEVDEILEPSPERVAPQCRHFGVCGGCQYQHAGYAAQVTMKQQILRETLSRAGVTVPAEIGVLAGEPWGYRNRIRLAFRVDGSFGYRSRGSHEIVPIAECPIAAPLLFETAEKLACFLEEHPATLAELELFVAPRGELLLTVFLERPTENLPEWLEALLAAVPATGIRAQLADGALSPTILGEVGEQSFFYSAAGFAYQVDHGAFFQVNRGLIDEFVALVTAGQQGKLAWDLYAGVGLFARRLTETFDRVLAVESAPASFPGLKRNLEGTSSVAIGSTTLEFLRRNREEREPRPDLIVLDPPRAGLGEDVTTLLNAIYAPKMVYVSCDPATLARDLRALTLERYRIESVTLVDMFPQTFHLETVVRLTRG